MALPKRCRLCKTYEDVQPYQIGTHHRHLCRSCYEKHDPALNTLKPPKPKKPKRPKKPYETAFLDKRLVTARNARLHGTKIRF